jgi:ferric-dicitrate binding protein FerR (iron transport regulator)
MKKTSVQISWGGLMVLLSLLGAAPFASADQPQQARVSQIIQDVRLMESHGAPRPAAVNDTVKQNMGVRTGVESRAELTFTDLTLTRLGANTIFSFKQGARELDLTSGAVLLQVPPKAPAVKVSTSAVTAAVTGGTALISTGPHTKFMVLEGIGSF